MDISRRWALLVTSNQLVFILSYAVSISNKFLQASEAEHGKEKKASDASRSSSPTLKSPTISTWLHKEQLGDLAGPKPETTHPTTPDPPEGSQLPYPLTPAHKKTASKCLPKRQQNLASYLSLVCSRTWQNLQVKDKKDISIDSTGR
jgi:hypothetical protein